MNFLLEITSRLRGAHGAQLIDRRLQQFDDVLFDLLANAGFFQSGQKVGRFDVGESAAKRTFDDIIIDHGHPQWLGNQAKPGALGTGVFAYPLQAFAEFGTVTIVAPDSDWDHSRNGRPEGNRGNPRDRLRS
jgi:hypothetical protein